MAIWSHKLLRWATPWFVLVVAGAGLVLGLGGQPVYLVAPLAVAALGGRGRRGAPARSGPGRHPWRAVTFVRSFAVVNIAFATGWLNVIRGREIEVWHRAEWRAEN